VPLLVTESYLTVSGANVGETDGIDISGNNHWVHDVEVTNQYATLLVDQEAILILDK
jgi:rhamnogalacturonan hydrolase